MNNNGNNNNMYYNPYMYNTYMQQQPMQQPIQQQMPYYNNNAYMSMPNINNTTASNMQTLTFVNGIEGAKAYIVNPNRTIYLKDSDSDTLFVKSANNEGKYTLKAYMLNEISLDNVGKLNSNINTLQQQNDYISKNDFKAFLSDFNERMNKLSSQVETLAYKSRTNVRKSDMNE